MLLQFYSICIFYGALRGKIYLEQVAGGVKIRGLITNVCPTGYHGFHVHENGNFDGNCTAAGPHYNPFNTTHGSETGNGSRHVGDLGNVKSNSHGILIVDKFDKVIRLTGPCTVNGRAIVVHANVDDLGLGGTPDSLKTGNSGARLDCCRIQQLYVDGKCPPKPRPKP